MLTKTAKPECNRRFDFTHYAGSIQEKDMFRLLKPLTLGLSVIGSVGVYSLTVAASASAFSFLDGGKTVGISASDMGKEFTINFDGNVNTNNVSGLSSEAIFTFLGFNKVGGNTEAIFDVSLTNNSKGITSRTSALGFDVWNFDGTNRGSDLNLRGLGNPSGSGNTRVEGLFTNDRGGGSFPNQFGNIDVCFTDGNNCQGGSNGGVTTGNTGKFKATLAFSGEVQTFALNNFGVRYQSINGQGFVGDSGTGRGTIDIGIPSEGPRQVPEPTTATALLLVGFGVLRYGKKKQQTLIQTEG